MSKTIGEKISGAEYSLSKIFSKEFEYVIPYYQRPYAWADVQTSELFDDLYDFYQAENDEGYFLGSIVLIKQKDIPKAEVIDGQQRLTTLTILLAALAFRSNNLNDKRAICQYILEEENPIEHLKANPRLSLRDKDQEFFFKYVQELRFDELFQLGQNLLENESQQNIQNNGKLLMDRIDQHFGNDDDSLRKFTSFLATRCYLVAVSTPNEQSAFRVFSVLNSRGLDLQPTDIIKAKIIGKIKESEREGFSERWEELESELGRSGFNDLFTYVRMIYAKEKSKRNLREEFEDHVLSKLPNSRPEMLVTDILEPYGETLGWIRNANFKSEANAEEINACLRWLNRIDNADWIPPTMMFGKEKNHDTFGLLRFLQRMERLAAYMHICSKGINFRIERYAQVIKGLEKEQISDSIPTEIELSEKEKNEFCEILNGNIYDLMSHRRNYLILRLDSFLSDGAASYNDRILTIEHVLPQTSENTEWANTWPELQSREQWVHRLANLVPLNKRRNSTARNFGFEKKKTAYFSGQKNVSSYALTSQVLSENEWTLDIVEKRQTKLLEILTDKWRLKPE